MSRAKTVRKELFFIRHGRSECNILRENGDPKCRTPQVLDSILAPLGVEQARKVATFSPSFGVECVFVSPLRRTLHTALLAFSSLPAASTSLSVFSNLRELYWEDYESRGLSKKSPRQFIEKFTSSLTSTPSLIPDLQTLEYLESSEDVYWAPDEEAELSQDKRSSKILSKRAHDAAATVLPLLYKHTAKKIAIVTHWGVLMNCFGLNARNCGVYKLVVDVDASDGSFVQTLETSLLDEGTGEFKAIHFPNPRFRIPSKQDSSTSTSTSSSSEVNKKVAKICVCGAGWWSQGWHLPQLSNNPNVEIVAIVEPNENPISSMATLENTVDLSKRYNVKIYRNVHDVLISGKDVDGFIVCTTHSTHYEIGAVVIKACKHLLLEKPLTTDPVEAQILVDLAKSTGYNGYFQVNHSANWRTQTKRACELVNTGAIGKVRHIVCHMGSPLQMLFEDNRQTGWIKLANGDASGFGWGQLTHILSWVLLVTQLEPIEAFCFMSYSDITGADIFNAGTVRFSNGATMAVSGVATMVETPKYKKIDNMIFGSEGEISYSGFDADVSSGSLVLNRHDGKSFSTPYDDEASGEGFLFENIAQGGLGPESLQTFIKACQGENDCWRGCDAEIGVKSVRIVDAFYRSAKSKKMEIV